MGKKIIHIEDYLDVRCMDTLFRSFDHDPSVSSSLRQLLNNAATATLEDEISSTQNAIRNITKLITEEGTVAIGRGSPLRSQVDYWEDKIRDKESVLSSQQKSIKELEKSILKAQKGLKHYLDNGPEKQPAVKNVQHSHGVWV